MTRHYLAALGATLLVACGGGRDASPAAGDASPPEPGREAARAATPVTPGPAGSTRMEITGTVAGERVSVSGTGECKHAADGSIFDRPAALWTARYSGSDGEGLQSLNLTFWRERSGTESLSLAVHMDQKTHRIATTEGGERQGSGRATLDGGTGAFDIDGTSDVGGKVSLRLRCERFTPLVAEGG
jgi:hypothetical protein